MKIAFSISILIISVSVYSQIEGILNSPPKPEGYSVPDNMLGIDKTWYIIEQPDNCSSRILFHMIKMGKDTILNFKRYKRVLDYSGYNIDNLNKKGLIIGFLRETEDKKIYINPVLYDKSKTEILLFDFNARINDTINNWIVSKVDSVLVQNIMRERLTLYSDYFDSINYWISGIVDMSYLFRYKDLLDNNKKSKSDKMDSQRCNSKYTLSREYKINGLIFEDSKYDNCLNLKIKK